MTSLKINILYWICGFYKILSFTAEIMSDQVIFGRQHVGIMSAESVGNYGVRWGLSCFIACFCAISIYQIKTKKKFCHAWFMTCCCLRVGYSLMTCTRQGSSHGITCTTWVLTNLVWWEITSELWESTVLVAIPREGNDIATVSRRPCLLTHELLHQACLPCNEAVQLSIWDVKTQRKDTIN